MVEGDIVMTYELGERFPSGLDFCCATLSPTTTGVLVDAAVEVAETRSMDVCVEGASVG